MRGALLLCLALLSVGGCERETRQTTMPSGTPAKSASVKQPREYRGPVMDWPKRPRPALPGAEPTVAQAPKKDPYAHIHIPPSAKADDGKQGQRREFLQGAIAKGIFTKIEKPFSRPYVWVDAIFMMLSYDQKSTFISVVYAYYFDGSSVSDSVILKNHFTGKEVGTYNRRWMGLKLK